MPPKILYVPNELDDFRQLGLRRPLTNLLDAGIVSEVRVFSLRRRLQDASDAERERENLIRLVASFQPDVILMQHLVRTGLAATHFARMRDAADFHFVYHEADPYRRPLHPLPSEARAAGRFADVVYTVGAGAFAQAFRRSGAIDVRWEPSPFDSERYRFAPIRFAERKFDVAIVANRNRPRLRGLPDWRSRIQFVELMQKRMGSRLAIYGRGWDGPGAMGPVPFSEQTSAIASAKLSANWDHFASEPRYFSNRLPISLAVGGIHATTLHGGYDSIFGDAVNDFLILGSTPSDLVEAIVHKVNDLDPDEWYAAAERARAFAHEHFRQDDQLVRFLNSAGPIVDPEDARRLWDERAEPLDEI